MVGVHYLKYYLWFWCALFKSSGVHYLEYNVAIPACAYNINSFCPGLLEQVCWSRSVGTGLLEQVCWSRSVGAGLLEQACWRE